jgi:L-iditol 2-dehydrogenase
MKAARISGPKKWEILDADMPQLKDGQCLIKLERWSVCGSDIRHAYGPVHPEEDYPMNIGGPCHECAGTIVESHSDKFKEGQRVIVLPTRGGTGGMVEYMAGDPDRMALLPDYGDLSEWVMCQPSGTVLYSCQQMGTILGKRVLVLGQGSIGLSFTAICARAGAKQVIAADLFDYRLEFSKRFGATHTVNPSRENLDEAVSEITGGRMPDITVEAAGYPDTLNAAFRLVGRFGKVILFGIQGGLAGQKTPIDTSYFLRSQATIIPTAGAGSGDAIGHIQNMVELRERGWWDPAQMITHRMKFDDVQRAYDMYENREDNVVKVVMSA